MSGKVEEVRFNFAKTVPTKEERDRCWASRDAFWKCMTTIYQHGPLAKDSPRPKVNYSKCRELRRAYEGSCPKTWIAVFDKQHGGFDESKFDESK